LLNLNQIRKFQDFRNPGVRSAFTASVLYYVSLQIGHPSYQVGPEARSQ